MSALTPDISDAGTASPTAEVLLPLTPLEADLSSAALESLASSIEETKMEAQQEKDFRENFASWMKKNIQKKECCFFDKGAR